MRLVCTSDWSWEQLSPYTQTISAKLRQLEERFPRDTKAEAVVEQCLNGELQLWLVLDGDEVQSVALTRIQTNPATGIKTVLITSMVGERGIEATPMMAEVEDWARDKGADEVTISGRIGWKRSLAAQGYRLDFAYFRKELN